MPGNIHLTLLAAFVIMFPLATQSQYLNHKVFLHLDRVTYRAGDDIFFTGYVFDHSNYLLTDRRTLYVELWHGMKRQQVRIVDNPDGCYYGDFHLPDDAEGGTYLVRAYTTWMRNLSNAYFHQQTIEVIASRNNIEEEPLICYQFFPESGVFVPGVENTIAIEATDQSGNPADLAGEILDDSLRVVARFRTEHQGRDFFSMILERRKYFVRINGDPVELNFDAPERQSEYALSVAESTDDLIVTILSESGRNGKRAAYMKLRTSAYDRDCIIARLWIDKPTVEFNIPKAWLPTGVTYIMLDDDKGITHCARPVFVNNNDTLGFEFDLYPSEKDMGALDLEIKIKTKDGFAAPGRYSLSVFEEPKDVSVKDFSSIAASLYLSSDLQDYVGNASGYMNATTHEQWLHRELLLLTRGGRDGLPGKMTTPYDLFGDRTGIGLAGRVLRPDGTVAAGERLRINSCHGVTYTRLDEKGIFRVLLACVDSTDIGMRPVDDRGQSLHGYRLAIFPFESFELDPHYDSIAYDSIFSTTAPLHLRYPGFSVARRFHFSREPGTDGIAARSGSFTLHWDPSLKVTPEGTAWTSFYLPPRPATYRVVIQGVSNDGIPGSASWVFTTN